MANFAQKMKARLSTSLHIPRYVIVLAIVLVAALDLRLQSVLHTEMRSPARADAREYVLYAYNLKNFGVYSQTETLQGEPQLPPVPDAKRTPLYPLFLVPFLDKPITFQNIESITIAQAIISTVTVLIVFLLSRTILPVPFALGAAALTALSPHLVTMNVYLLSETLFCFFLVTAIYLTIAGLKRENTTLIALAGATLAAASLTHPVATYFVLPLIVFLLVARGWRSARRPVALMLLGFCLVYGPWVARNFVTLESGGDNNLMRIVLRTGAYPDLMYNGDRNSFPFPYKADPNFKETSKDIPSVLAEVTRSFREEPIKQLRWYVVGKPLMLYSWDMMEGQTIDQRGDVFTYTVISSPYFYLPHFRLTHAFMRITHLLFVSLMLVGICAIWLPAIRSYVPDSGVFALRIVSLLLLYHLAIMVIGVPISRYSIPMRPFMYVIAMVPLLIAGERLWARHKARRAALAAESKLHP